MITLTKYSDLKEYITAFGQKQINLLVIKSRGGLGKTFLTEEALIEFAPLVFSGYCTPLSLYKELYHQNEIEKDFLCVFDDLDSLLCNKTIVALLKQALDTRDVKTVKYCSTTKALDGINNEFETSLKAILLTNNIITEDANLTALLTRSIIIEFNPSDMEILQFLKTFAKDVEIINFISKYAPFSKNLNLRVYKRAKELKLSGIEWKNEVVNSMCVDIKLYEIDTLLKKYKTDKEREAHFSGSRSNYYLYKKQFLSKTKICQTTN